MNDFFSRINMEERDFFVKLREVMVVKMELLEKHPDLIGFYETLYVEKSSEVIEDLENKKQELTAISVEKLFANIDISKFKDNLDIGSIINIIMWTFDGLSNRELKKAKELSLKHVDYNKIFAETDNYIEIFKQSFYK